MQIERPIVTQYPENSETPLSEMRSWVTPNTFFFVRNHFAEPEVTIKEWRLQVQGHVRKPRVWTWEDLTELPERTVFATLECAGNGRSFLHRPEPGVQWGAGAVGHAEWSGVPLATVLEASRPLSDALEVLCEGADSGTEPDQPELMRFARGLPLAKAMHPDTLLAFQMNGEPLSRSHGAPVRLIIPGWYGVCSVKWITRLEFLDFPFEGYFQTNKYTIRRRGANGERLTRLTRMAVKSQIIRPRAGSELRPGVNRISGIAWAGEEAVAKVEVSVDGGQTWRTASLVGPQAPYSWTLWEYLWQVNTPKDYRLVSRAISTMGETQPADHDSLRGGYMINFFRPHPVRVIPSGRAQDSWGDRVSRLDEMVLEAEELSRKRLDIDLDSEFSDGGGI
ncbi:MAG: sulfite oxidase [Acidobacteria bacterium]|nr:MAG: sulfite oxidase [Acidobacteriota bacterium]